MFVHRISSWQEANALRGIWNLLAGSIPFRRWEWLGTWWQYYGQDREWFVVAIYEDDGTLRGLAPWFIEEQPAYGRVINFLGTGETCTDYLSILCKPEDGSAVAAALAHWLIQMGLAQDTNLWDLMQLDGALANDPVVSQLLDHLEQRGCSVHRRPGANIWRVPLPATWDEYRQQLSKPNRRHIRMLQERWLDPGKVRVRHVNGGDDFSTAWQAFVDLHQRRKQSVGQPGCFASSSFGKFLRHASEEFRARDALELLFIDAENSPIAVQLAFLGEGITYAYQTGMDPDMLAASPGWLVHTQSIKRAIEAGRGGFDFLRGDESHKHRMGAEPTPLMTARVVPPRFGPTMLHKAWVTGTTMKNWIKTGLEITGMR